mmetsp:Transcript_61057/g.133668  ORF Transcript_61057/g.133668 Transcript_61057/m.133668 type:complete len:204 (-) Transcript_61057:17-628(-)
MFNPFSTSSSPPLPVSPCRACSSFSWTLSEACSCTSANFSSAWSTRSRRASSVSSTFSAALSFNWEACSSSNSSWLLSMSSFPVTATLAWWRVSFTFSSRLVGGAAAWSSSDSGGFTVSRPFCTNSSPPFPASPRRASSSFSWTLSAMRSSVSSNFSSARSTFSRRDSLVSSTLSPRRADSSCSSSSWLLSSSLLPIRATLVL